MCSVYLRRLSITTTELLIFRKILLVFFFCEKNSFSYLRHATEHRKDGTSSHTWGFGAPEYLIYLACTFPIEENKINSQYSAVI